MAFAGEMERQTKLLRRRQLSKKRKNQVRQDQLVSGYIHIKYPTLYQEAIEFYQTMDSRYPDKTDLRKTALFKELKTDIPNHQPPTQPQSTVITEPPSSLSSALSYIQSSTPTPTFSPEGQTTYSDNMVLKIPLISPQPNKPTPERTEEMYDLDQPTPERTEEMYDLDQPTPERTEEMFDLDQEKTEEMQAVDAIHPTLVEELSPVLIDQIIEQLRTEPDLQNIFTQVEEEFFLKELDMDIDIDIPEDLLEKELYQW